MLGDVVAAKTHLTALKHLHAEFKNLTQLPTPENPGDVADLLGELRFIETLLAGWRRGLIVETDDGAGEGYELVTSRKCKRTFNVDRIVSDVANKIHCSIEAAWNVLQRKDALRVTAGWTDLKAALQAFDVPLVIGKGDVTGGDLDAPHVGEVWSDTRTVQPIKQEGKQ